MELLGFLERWKDTHQKAFRYEVCRQFLLQEIWTQDPSAIPESVGFYIRIPSSDNLRIWIESARISERFQVDS